VIHRILLIALAALVLLISLWSGWSWQDPGLAVRWAVSPLGLVTTFDPETRLWVNNCAFVGKYSGTYGYAWRFFDSSLRDKSLLRRIS
jgi:hypothetical protein